MGWVGTVLKAIFWPSLIYFALLAHVVYQTAKTPVRQNAKVVPWPSAASAKDKAGIIASRKIILDDFVNTISGKSSDFFSKHATEDARYEDPSTSVSGIEDLNRFAAVINSFSDLSRPLTYRLHGEEHHPHEIVRDWTLTFHIPRIPFPMSLTMKTHWLLEPPAKKGGREKVFKVFEEWGRNPILSEETFKPSLVGKLHAKLRKVHGDLLLFLWAKK